ncbi:MAG: hypothetical protein WCS64_02705 [Dehalococcoidales bacterium]|jgi:hypothetical protein
MFGDFLRGTFGCMMQLVLVGLALLFGTLGFVSCASDNSGIGGIFIFLSILCLAAEFGIRYALGNINRIR